MLLTTCLLERIDRFVLKQVRLLRSIHLVPFTMNSVLTNNTVVPVYNEFSHYKRYSWSHLQVNLWLAIHLVSFTTNSVTTTNSTMEAIYEFGFFKQYSWSCLKRVRFISSVIHQVLLTNRSSQCSVTTKVASRCWSNCAKQACVE